VIRGYFMGYPKPNSALIIDPDTANGMPLSVALRGRISQSISRHL